MRADHNYPILEGIPVPQDKLPKKSSKTPESQDTDDLPTASDLLTRLKISTRQEEKHIKEGNVQKRRSARIISSTKIPKKCSSSKPNMAPEKAK